MSIFSRKISMLDSGLLEGFIDHHSHLLPGVDDGFETAESSLEALDYMQQAGVAEIWFTPHIMEDVPNRTADLKQHFETFNAAYMGSIRLNQAAENMMDNLFNERWEARDLLMLTGNHPLIETSYFRPPMEMQGIIGEMLNSGFRPILAHPERYKYMEQSDYDELKELGVIFQLNLGSIAGSYSPTTKEKAEWLLQKGYYNLMGSDIHNLPFYRHTVNAPLSKKTIDRLRLIPNHLEDL